MKDGELETTPGMTSLEEAGAGVSESRDLLLPPSQLVLYMLT